MGAGRHASPIRSSTSTPGQTVCRRRRRRACRTDALQYHHLAARYVVQRDLRPDPVWGLQVPFVVRRKRSRGQPHQDRDRQPQPRRSAGREPIQRRHRRDHGLPPTAAPLPRPIACEHPDPGSQHRPPDAERKRSCSTRASVLRACRSGRRAPINFAYDARGRLASATQGSRVTTFSYGADGYMSRADRSDGPDDALRLRCRPAPRSRPRCPTAESSPMRYDANGNRRGEAAGRRRSRIASPTRLSTARASYSSRRPSPGPAPQPTPMMSIDA